MIKLILVPTDGSEFAMVGVRYAAEMARHYGATLHGLHVVDLRLLEGPILRDISASLGTAPYVNYQGNIAMVLEERGRAALQAVEQVCAELGIKCETFQDTGIVPRTIVERGELADLIVMGRGGEHGEWLEGLVGSTTQAVVRRANRPVLVTGIEKPGRDLFLVAYDGSPHAKRGLQEASTLSAEWQAPLHVLSVGGDRAEAALDEARGYLDAHGVPVTYVRREGDPSEAIVAYASECRADLLAMGAYGHTKVRQLVVGSTTAYAMNHAPCPVLLTR
jgi:nucleotide-binding universal stress UspA family protein